MALIKLGGGVTDIRGSIGGSTFARNKGGNYIRSNKKPVNPRASDQMARRAVMAYLNKYWSATLTAQQRTDWRAYALGTTWTNRLGESIEINGNAAFIRLNTLRYMSSLAIQAAAPTAYGHAGGLEFTFAAENDTTKLQIAEPSTGFDKDTDEDNMWFFMGIPSEPGRISTPKGFKYVGTIAGSSVSAPSFPVELDAAYTMQAGQLVTVRAMFQDADFRLSGPWYNQVAAAPSS